MESLWKKYFEEKGLIVEETEAGFCSAILSNGICLIENWYVVPERRKSVAAMRMVFKVIEKAKKLNCNSLCGEIFKSDKDFNYILNMHKKFGMEVVEEDEFHVLTSKSLTKDK